MTDDLKRLKDNVDNALAEMNDAYAEADYYLDRAKGLEEDYQDALQAWEAECERLVG